MKNEEKLNIIKDEIEALTKKFAELTDEEMGQIAGGNEMFEIRHKYSVGMVFRKRVDETELTFTIRTLGIEVHEPAYYGPFVAKDLTDGFTGLVDDNKCFTEKELTYFFTDGPKE